MSVSTEAWLHQCHLPPLLRAPRTHNNHQRIKSSCQVMPDRTHRGVYQSYCNTSNYGCYPYSSSRFTAGCYARCSMIQWRCIPTCKAAERIVRKLKTERSKCCHFAPELVTSELFFAPEKKGDKSCNSWVNVNLLMLHKPAFEEWVNLMWIIAGNIKTHHFR